MAAKHQVLIDHETQARQGACAAHSVCKTIMQKYPQTARNLEVRKQIQSQAMSKQNLAGNPENVVKGKNQDSKH